MNPGFASLSSIPLGTDVAFERPPQLPYLVHRDDPALDVMTDFRYIKPVTVAPGVPIDAALQKMKNAGVRLLLVTDPQKRIVGLITARDIQGDRPIKLSETNRISRADLSVEMVMTPQAEITVLNFVSVRNAQVGHIEKTLHDLERQHILVVEVDEASGEQCVCGMFSLSQIARQLGEGAVTEVPAAHSLAEMVHELG